MNNYICLFTNTKCRMNKLKAAILATDGFEQSELEYPMNYLKKANISVDIISLKKGTIKGWKESDWGDQFKVDVVLNKAKPTDYDLLVLPGGVMNSDTIRTIKSAIKWVTAFFENGIPIAAICHSPWILIETGLVEGKWLTSYPTLKTDLINAGAEWIDEEVVVDHNLITSRSPKDLPAFCEKIVEVVKK